MMNKGSDAWIATNDEKYNRHGPQSPEQPFLVWAPSHKVNQHNAESVQRVVDHGSEQEELAHLNHRTVVLGDQVVVRVRVGHRLQAPNMEDEVENKGHAREAMQHPGKHPRPYTIGCHGFGLDVLRSGGHINNCVETRVPS